MEYKFCDKIRQIRERKNITMKDVAECIGVSESLISQIERNKVSPAIDTLLNIADKLDIDLEFLFSDFKKNKPANLVKLGDRGKILMQDIVYEKLSRTDFYDKDHGIEAYYLEIKTGGKKGSSEYGHEGKELGIIIEGCGVFTIGSIKYELNEGDSISFSSSIPHVLENTGKKPLRAYWIITPPKMFFDE